jgi:DNA topoisomerase-2
MDGLKPSQRKILFACIKRRLHSEIKVAQLAGYTSEHAAYHHGEASLNSTIVGMAQNYVGSNNINLLAPNGQFGTRLLGGKDAASPRYIFTQLATATELIFRPEDAPLYEYLEDDGQSIEPAYYMPVLPMILVNGANGIGTGWSTTIPSYNPKDIVQNIKRMLAGASPVEMVPWFKGFEGVVVSTDEGKYNIEGKWEWKTASTLHVSELPVGTWTNNYKEFLEKWQEGTGKYKSGQVLSIKSNHTDTKVSFTVKLAPQFAATLQKDQAKLQKAFKLVSTTSIGNMHAFGADSKMKRYTNVLSILSEFFSERLRLYSARKAHQLKVLQEMIQKLTAKIKFLTAVVSGQISFRGKQKQELVRELANKGYPKDASSYDYLLGMPLWNMTQDKISALTSEHQQIKRQLNALTRMTVQQIWNNELDELLDAITPKQNKKRKQTDSGHPNNKVPRQKVKN